MGSDERRIGPRLDLRLRVRFITDEAMPEAEATDISPGGARIESRVPIEAGSEVNIELDAGDGESVATTAKVAWCRPRKNVSMRKLYDVGVRFETEWLGQKRGKLGRALGQIFSFGDFEPARAFDRVVVTMRAAKLDEQNHELTVVDVSEGGMQLRSDGSLGAGIHTGAPVIVEIPLGDSSVSLEGEIAWVAEQDKGDAALYSSFGVRFGDLQANEIELLRAIKDGETEPHGISLFLPG